TTTSARLATSAKALNRRMTAARTDRHLRPALSGRAGRDAAGAADAAGSDRPNYHSRSGHWSRWGHCRRCGLEPAAVRAAPAVVDVTGRRPPDRITAAVRRLPS